MQRLNFPAEYAFEFRDTAAGREVLDPQRQRFVRLTPEEWVRQNLVQHLIADLGYQAGNTAVEKGIDVHGQFFRADVIVHDRQGSPLLLAECKEPTVRLDQKTFDQVAIYNREVQAPCLLLTNGLVHYCWLCDPDKDDYRSLEAIPRFDELTARQTKD